MRLGLQPWVQHQGVGKGESFYIRGFLSDYHIFFLFVCFVLQKSIVILHVLWGDRAKSAQGHAVGC